MEIVRGIVSRAIQSQEIVHSEEEGAGIGQIIACQIGRRDVHISMPTVPNIRNGDEVIVAGRMKQATLMAYAYKNVTTGSQGRLLFDKSNLFVTVPIVLGMTLIIAPLLLLSIPWAIWQWVKEFRIRRAYRAVIAEGRAAELTDTRDNDQAEAVEPILEEPIPAVISNQFSFACPRCGKQLKMNKAVRGKKVRCPRKTCGAVIDTSTIP